jgi:4-hydroxy-2-oxoheptanedioate aldolase
VGDLRAVWAAGDAAHGAWISLREPFLAEVASKAGWDYVCIDLQHGIVGFEHLHEMLAAVALGTAAPIVRVPWNEPWMIGRALDAGAAGVIVPLVNDADEAARAVAACRYAPAGARSYGPTGANLRNGPASTAAANDSVLCIVMVETAQAVARIEEILAVPGIDGVYIGPSDLSLTLGLPPGLDQTDERFTGALATVVDACVRRGVVPGIHADAAIAPRRREQGFRLVTAGFDLAPAVSALRNDLGRARGDQAAPGTTSPYGER